MRMVKTSTILLALMLIFASLVTVGCKNNTPEPKKFANVTFKFGSEAFTSGNIENYRIQYRALPLFGNIDTAGRKTNWTDAPEENPASGSFITRGLECGDWIFYVRVSDANRTFIDVCTGTVTVNGDYVVVINEEDTDLSGYGTQDIYIRTDYVYDGQGVRISYANTADGQTFEVAQNDMQVVKTGKSSIDYFVNTGSIPAANYVVTVDVFGQGGTKIMSKQETVRVRSTGTDALVMRIKSDGSTSGGIVIGGTKELEGILKGPKEAFIGDDLEFNFIALTEYTVENAVWYYWYAEGQRSSTKEPKLEIKFNAPGSYVISCTPIGINGEVMKGGVCEWTTFINLKEDEGF